MMRDVLREFAPMRRGLKRSTTGPITVRQPSERIRPDAKGTETGEKLEGDMCNFPLREFAPMRRGLKRTRGLPLSGGRTA